MAIPSQKRAIEAIFAGVDTLAHPVIQGPVSDSFVRLMKSKLTPEATTLTVGENYSRLAEHPAEADRLLPLLAVAVRSLRGPEFRAGLAGVVSLAESKPELVPLIRQKFPELEF